jgi:GT2 family glycosyltransferase
MDIAKSQTLAGLADALTDPHLAESIDVVLWDNSPQKLTDPTLPFPFHYGWAERNLGTAGAYNHALAIAEERGIPWLLLLDQDTDLTSTFLHSMVHHSREQLPNARVGSIVPFIHSRTKLVSPRLFQPFNRSKPVARSFSGELLANAYALNSGSVMRVSALREIGGYSEDFWLDLSDVYAFQQLFEHGKSIFVAGDIAMNHALSATNFEEEMDPEHYEEFMAAESAYLQIFRSRFVNHFQTAWLPLRALRQYIEYDRKEFAGITWSYFVKRLKNKPHANLQSWIRHLRERRDIPWFPPVERK